MSDQKGIRFIRVRGRIVPIRRKVETGVGVGAIGVGAAVAADAARTNVVRQSKGLTLIQKSFQPMPMALAQGHLEMGHSITAFKGNKAAGKVFFSKEGTELGIDWLSVKRPFRGQGISKTLVRETVAQSKAKTMLSHVVHPRSAELFAGKVKSTYFKEAYINKAGESILKRTSKESAMRSVARWQQSTAESSKAGWKGFFKKDVVKKTAAPVFREVKLPRIRPQGVPFKNLAIKLKLGAGVAAAFAGAALLLGRNNNGR